MIKIQQHEYSSFYTSVTTATFGVPNCVLFYRYIRLTNCYLDGCQLAAIPKFCVCTIFQLQFKFVKNAIFNF